MNLRMNIWYTLAVFLSYNPSVTRNPIAYKTNLSWKESLKSFFQIPFKFSYTKQLTHSVPNIPPKNSHDFSRPVNDIFLADTSPTIMWKLGQHRPCSGTFTRLIRSDYHKHKKTLQRGGFKITKFSAKLKWELCQFPFFTHIPKLNLYLQHPFLLGHFTRPEST